MNKQDSEFKNMTIDGVKALFPGFGENLTSGISSGDPAYRLIENDDLLESLKVVYFPNIEHANNVRDALAECLEALTLAKTKDEIKEVMTRIDWIKIHCATMCSINAMFADQFKQTAIRVATTTSTEKGIQAMQMPMGKGADQIDDGKNKPGRKP